jgi:hypothetical protein
MHMISLDMENGTYVAIGVDVTNKLAQLTFKSLISPPSRSSEHEALL